MKLAYITHYAPIPSTDADTVCIMESCQGFARAGADVSLIIPSRYIGAIEIGSEQEIWDFYGMDKEFIIQRIPSAFLYRLGFPGRLIYKFFSVFSGMLRGSDVIYVRHFELALLAGIFGKKIVLENHQISEHTNKVLFKVIILLSGILRIKFVTISSPGKKKLIEAGVPSDKIIVAPMGISLEDYQVDKSVVELRKDLNLPVDANIVMYCGSLYEGRGIEELITAMIEFPELILVIVGGEKHDLVRCQKLVEENNQENVLFIGQVLPKRVPVYLMAADILAMPYTTRTPTYRDMSPMKMFEYLASGKPIISSDFPVLREVLEHKKNALLVKPDTPEAISDGIRWMLDHPEEAGHLGTHAKKDVQGYSWDQRSKRIIGWLNNEAN